MTDVGSVGHGASCALHPDQRATGTCARCGNFMCVLCSQGGEHAHCPTCRERTGEGRPFPLRRDTWSFSALWDYCLALFKQHWLMISAALLIVGGIGFIVNLMSQLLPLIGNLVESQVVTVILTVVAVLVQNVVQGVLGIGMSRMLMDVLQGQPPRIERVFSQFHKAGPYLVTMLLVLLFALIPAVAIAGIGMALVAALGDSAIWVGIGLGVLAIVPLTYFLLPLVLLQPQMASRDDLPSPMQMLRNCYTYARGERANIFGVLVIQMLLVFAGVLACCVGAIPAMALASLLTAGLYLTLSNGADAER